MTDYFGITTKERAGRFRPRPSVELSVLKAAYPEPKIGDPVRLDMAHFAGDYEVAIEPVDEGESWRLSLIGLPAAAVKWDADLLDHVREGK